MKMYFETIQECELFNAGTNLSKQKYDIDQVFKIIEQAKKEVFDDIEKILFNKEDEDAYIGTKFSGGLLQDIKKRHLSTFQKKSDIISDTKKSDDFLYQKGKQNPQDTDEEHYEEEYQPTSQEIHNLSGKVD